MAATLFDYNGVLVDDEYVHLAAFRDVLGPLGVTVTDRDYAERYLGCDDAGAFRAILADCGRSVNDETIRELIGKKKPRYRARAEASLAVFEGAAELVRACAAAGPVGIVSGALRDEITFGLERMGVTDDIAFVVSAEDVLRGKPDPEGYNAAIARLGAERAPSAVVVEDSLAGIRSAKSAGLVCVAVAHSYPRAELLAAGADLVQEHVRDVTVEALTRFWAR
jgi:HAD superfamily hydrolase (TIGR01509 family)